MNIKQIRIIGEDNILINYHNKNPLHHPPLSLFAFVIMATLNVHCDASQTKPNQWLKKFTIIYFSGFDFFQHFIDLF